MPEERETYGFEASPDGEQTPERSAKKPALAQILSLAAFILVIGGLSLASLIVPTPDVLTSERRRPTALPPLNVSNVLDARFQDKFEDWAADGFVARDAFRTIRAATVFKALMMTDKDGLFFGKAGAGKLAPVDAANLRATAAKIDGVIKDLGAKHDGLSFYYAIIPDKSVYDDRELPGFDPEMAASILGEGISGAKAIDILAALSAEDFYRSDLHWDQVRLGAQMTAALGADATGVGVVDALGQAMGFSARIDAGMRNFELRDVGAFEGVYAGQFALPIEADRLAYLSNETIRNMSASYLSPEAGHFVDGPVYDLQAGSGRDPYDLFCGGAQPLIRIDNPAAATNKELYLFRDSFGSSLAPLLAQGYASVTLIDLRYVDYRMLEQFIEISPDADVLFCYSSQILDNPSVILAP